MTDDNITLPSLEESLAMMVDRVERAALDDRFSGESWKDQSEPDRRVGEPNRRLFELNSLERLLLSIGTELRRKRTVGRRSSDK